MMTETISLDESTILREQYSSEFVDLYFNVKRLKRIFPDQSKYTHDVIKTLEDAEALIAKVLAKKNSTENEEPAITENEKQTAADLNTQILSIISFFTKLPEVPQGKPLLKQLYEILRSRPHKKKP